LVITGYQHDRETQQATTGSAGRALRRFAATLAVFATTSGEQRQSSQYCEQLDSAD
jgi:restriction endonuclease Mrr